MTGEINHDRRGFLAGAAIVGLEITMLGATKSLLRGFTGLAGAKANGPLSALSGATEWLNSRPLTADGVRGRVVLVNFWTYTCINWLRQLPYIRAWAEKYSGRGLVVIGAHTPEFGFEHDIKNVHRAVRAMRVEYPVAVDSDYAIWNAFGNQYWPALYFIDARGSVRHQHFGEGSYGESEGVIQKLLRESGQSGIGAEDVTVKPSGFEVAADWDNLRSPENYLGTDRTERFVSTPRNHQYTVPTHLRLNDWALAGDWTVGRQAVTLNAPNGRIVNRFHARDLHLVMGPAAKGATVRYRLHLDGQAPGAAHGGDVNEMGEGAVKEQRLYQLIRQPQPIVDRQFEIEFLDPGVEAFAFTFG